MYLISLLLPLTMLVMGLIFVKRPPKEINDLYGYRTLRSMKSQEAWDFANRYMGKIWAWLGFAMTILSIVATIIANKLGEDFMLKYIIILTIVQLVVMIIPIFFVEKELKKNFDDYGRARK